MQRQIIKSDRKARELMQEFKDYSLGVADYQTQIEKLEAERNKLAMKGQKVKEKLKPIQERLTAGEIQEFEVVINMKSGVGASEIIIELVNALEQWKEAYRKRGGIPDSIDTKTK